MSSYRPFPLVISASAKARVDAATAFLRSFPAEQPVNVVSANRSAADDLVRRIAYERGATLGVSRYSLLELAARLAVPRLGSAGIAPASGLGREAIAARAGFEATAAGVLTYFGAVAGMPGFPRALAGTLEDLLGVDIEPANLAQVDDVGPDLSTLLAGAARAFQMSGTADRSAFFAAAAEGVDDEPRLSQPLLLLDVAVNTPVEERFLAALVRRSASVLATSPAHDGAACAALERAGGVRDERAVPLESNLDRLRTFLFAGDAPLEQESDGTLEFFSAPGEGRECVEMARRILAEARRGVRFDEMAVLVRAPQSYQGLLEHALERAGIPAWFDRGIRRPRPAGRAFLAMLYCAGEGLSARRFAEYLSLGQVPAATAPHATTWTPPRDAVLGLPVQTGAASGVEPADEPSSGGGTDEAAGGVLATPRRWEQLLVEAAVIGGSPERWARRIQGLVAEFSTRLAEARRDDPASSRVASIERDIERLERLRDFALPIIEELAGWPDKGLWSEWLDRLGRLVPRVLRTSEDVQRVLADLRPMAEVGPVGLGEVRSVLESRLLTLENEPPAKRYGRVFVAHPDQVRGHTFEVVFVPGLAERMFPQRPRQDPLLPDAGRRTLDGRLPTIEERNRQERLLLHLAVGSAITRLYVSYPRIDVGVGRARVPSFYALDLIRGATGTLPDHEALAQAAVRAGDPSLAWPAPADPASAIDDEEHDLAILRDLLDSRDPSSVRGRAQYLLTLSPPLRRSVTERWARSERRWSQFDGLIRVTERTQAALSKQRFDARPYSLSALQRFAVCPYQFLLSAVYRLQPGEEPRPLRRMDPLTRGSLVHRIQAAFLRQLRQEGRLPVTSASVPSCRHLLHDAIERIAEEYRDALMPAIDRVWRDEVAAIERDLEGWLRRLADDGGTWTPEYFELGFGLPPDETRDPGSSPNPVVVGGRFPLRGAIDLVERNRSDRTLRVTDHKTGKNRAAPGLVIGGGKVLQPVLYSLVVEALTGERTAEARLSYCTVAGGFSERVVPMTDTSRHMGVTVLEIVDRAIEHGWLAPAPEAGACAWCDFRVVCGPDEEARVARKSSIGWADLVDMRRRP